jgi:glycosyltransferase involved in cell wall biosynthesis
MKFLHLSTGDVRGAFSAAYRLHRNLIAHGHESVMLVGEKQTQDPTVVAPPRSIQFLGRSLVRAANQLLKLACGRETQVRHHFAFNIGVVSVRTLVKALDGFRPDLIVVHYTSGFVSPAALAELRSVLGAPMAMYLMDMEMLTGACHYAWDCPGYLASCENCPPARSGVVRHLIRHQWRARKKSFDRMAPVVVPASGWLSRQAAAGSLTRDLPRRQILIGIDPRTHAPADRRELRRKFGLPEDALVLLFGAQNLADARKGFRHLKAALHQLAQALSASEREKVVLFTVGKLDAHIVGTLPLAHVHRSYIADPSLFAATYAAADLFICPSVEDSGPMMINEAIVSGTPVAAFEMGVAVDLVVDGVTGFRVPLGDAQALAAAMARFVRLPAADRATMSAACRALGVETSSAQAQVQAFVELARTAVRGVDAAERGTMIVPP